MMGKWKKAARAGAVGLALGLGVMSCAPTSKPKLLAHGTAFADAATLQAGMTDGAFSAQSLTALYLQRIQEIDRNGPTLNSVLAVNPEAVAQARALDEERGQSKIRGPLHGLPVLIKDNIETKEPIATTAGSLALVKNITGRDAPLVARLRSAGVVMLGKANLSEWANFRDGDSMSGWSGIGGQTRNPHVLDRSPCGSSSGSGAAIAAGLAWAAIGTETDGSIVCPAAINGIVGLKPTLGLVSRTHIIPISASQDTAGPMARSVRDAALLLNAMSGSDPTDPATKEADARKTDYSAGLSPDALRGKRIGVARFLTGYHTALDVQFETALKALRAAGADVIDITEKPKTDGLGAAEFFVLQTEFKVGLNAYLASASPAVKTRTLADVIRFNTETPRALALFGQRIFVQSEATKGLADPAYLAAAANAKRIARGVLDGYFAPTQFDAIVAPTYSPAWLIDPALGDHFIGGASQLPAVAGYPHLTVPMGEVLGLPVGISFIGPAWSEAKLLAMGFAFETRAPARRVPTFQKTLAPEAQKPAG